MSADDQHLRPTTLTPSVRGGGMGVWACKGGQGHGPFERRGNAVALVHPVTKREVQTPLFPLPHRFGFKRSPHLPPPRSTAVRPWPWCSLPHNFTPQPASCTCKFKRPPHTHTCPLPGQAQQGRGPGAACHRTSLHNLPHVLASSNAPPPTLHCPRAARPWPWCSLPQAQHTTYNLKSNALPFPRHTIF